MSNRVSPQPASWKRSRYGFAGFCFLSLLAGWLLLRLVLIFASKPGALSLADAWRALLSGLHRDVFVALVETAPVLVWLLIMRNHWFGARWHRLLFLGGCFLFWLGQIFLLFVEFFFFEEFKSRFNTVAVDYLIYPQEVFVNIWESYHVGVVLALCL